MNIWLKVIGIAGGFAANIVMAGMMILIMMSQTQSIRVVYGIEFWVEIPLALFSSIILLKWMWEEINCS